MDVTYLLKPKYYISPMDVAQNSVFRHFFEKPF